MTSRKIKTKQKLDSASCLGSQKKRVLQLPQVERMVAQGFSEHQRGKFQEAKSTYERVLRMQPDNFACLQLMGTLSAQTKNHKKAIEFLSKAIQINPNFGQCYYNRGLALQELQRFEEALIDYDKAISIKSDYAEAYANRGMVLQELRRFEEALVNYDTAISIKSDYAEAYANRGLVLLALKRFKEAIASCDQAIEIKPNFSEAYNNRGLAAKELRYFDIALDCYKKAIDINPEYAEAYANCGNVFTKLQRLDEALSEYDKSISIKSDYAEAYANRGAVLRELQRLDEALASYEIALTIKPEMDWLFGNYLHSKMLLCEWNQFESQILKLINSIQLGKKASIPFPMLALIDDPKLHRKVSETYVRSTYPPDYSLDLASKNVRKDTIRVGYFSADFKNHPVSHLTAELFELHDKDNFEIFAFSLGNKKEDPTKSRLKAAFNDFFEVDENSDVEIAQISRNIRIDIAVDLGGFTSNSRTGIFALRAAPIQIHYIGYLGTMGAEYIDYTIADSVILPSELQKCFSEKIIYLPSFQVNDRKREISSKQFTRAELGIPGNAFVFCSFNNNYKITPSVFTCWMTILKAVENSVLFIYADNEIVKVNLQVEAKARGIDPIRLIFAARISYADYLARYKCADLFLDTSPYNAGTTASDALWAGLPVLTIIGQSFPSRMAASLLTAIGLPELITSNLGEYQQLAIELAIN